MKPIPTVAAVGVVLAACLATPRLTAQTTDLRADYERATSVRGRVQNKIYDVIDTPTWIEGSAKFWYRKTVKGGNQFVLVDPGTATKVPAFDHTRLAAALSTGSGVPYTALTLPFTTMTFVNNLGAIEFDATTSLVVGRAGTPATAANATAGVPRWRCTLDDYQCIRIPALAAPVPSVRRLPVAAEASTAMASPPPGSCSAWWAWA